MALKNINLSNLSSPTSPSVSDMVGKKYGRLLILEYLGNYIKGKSAYTHVLLAKCDCGNTGVYRAASIKVGHTTSCGCYLKENASNVHTVHGHAASYTTSKTYRSWVAMRNRCYNPKNNYYHRYGGRGIRVCERWLESFTFFLHDMGEAPIGRTLDRYPNKDGDYEPTNCRWATPVEQMRNVAKNVFYKYNGEDVCVIDLEKIAKVSARTIRHRIHVLGWGVEAAINTPPLKGKQTYNKKYSNYAIST